MRTELLQNFHWFDHLNLENAPDVTEEIARRLNGRTVTVVYDNPSCLNMEIYPDQTLVGNYSTVDTNSAVINLTFSRRRFYFDVTLKPRTPYEARHGHWYVVFEGDQICFYKGNDRQDTLRVYLICQDEKE